MYKSFHYFPSIIYILILLGCGKNELPMELEEPQFKAAIKEEKHTLSFLLNGEI